MGNWKTMNEAAGQRIRALSDGTYEIYQMGLDRLAKDEFAPYKIMHFLVFRGAIDKNEIIRTMDFTMEELNRKTEEELASIWAFHEAKDHCISSCRYGYNEAKAFIMKLTRNQITVDTPAGTLIASVKGDNKYPGLWISVSDDETDPAYGINDIGIAMIECETTKNNHIQTICWSRNDSEFVDGIDFDTGEHITK